MASAACRWRRTPSGSAAGGPTVDAARSCRVPGLRPARCGLRPGPAGLPSRADGSGRPGYHQPLSPRRFRGARSTYIGSGTDQLGRDILSRVRSTALACLSSSGASAVVLVRRIRDARRNPQRLLRPCVGRSPDARHGRPARVSIDSPQPRDRGRARRRGRQKLIAALAFSGRGRLRARRAKPRARHPSARLRRGGPGARGLPPPDPVAPHLPTSCRPCRRSRASPSGGVITAEAALTFLALGIPADAAELGRHADGRRPVHAGRVVARDLSRTGNYADRAGNQSRWRLAADALDPASRRADHTQGGDQC